MPKPELQPDTDFPAAPFAGGTALPESLLRDFAARKADMSVLCAREAGMRRIFLPPVTDVKRLTEREGEDFVRAAFESLLGRAPTPAELALWVEKTEQGADKTAFLLELAHSEEGERQSIRLGGFPEVSLTELLAFSGRDFVENAYALLLGRSADPEGMESNLRALQSGAASPTEILYGLCRSDEAHSRCVRVPGLEEAVRKEQRSRRLRSLPLLGSLFRSGEEAKGAPSPAPGTESALSSPSAFLSGEIDAASCPTLPLKIPEILAAVPDEEILCELLDLRGFHILVADPVPGSDAYELIWQAMQLYLFRAGDAFRFYFFSDAVPEETEAAALHSLRDKAVFLGVPDKEHVLSYFLGCDALLSFSPAGDAAALAGELHLPVICPCLTEGFSFEDGQILVGRSPYDLAAALRLVREGNYRELFTRRPSPLRNG